MGVKPKPVGPTPEQMARDNDAALKALSARAAKLDENAKAIDAKLANDPDLAAYPQARKDLAQCAATTKKQQAVIAQEQAIRGRLGQAAAAGDRDGIAAARAELAALKKANPKAYGKGNVADPVASCHTALSTAKCDTNISKLKYGEQHGPGSPVARTNPCYGTILGEWEGWDDLIANGCATAEEKSIIQAMSANEGSFEAVQAYDNAQLTAGAMQKTMNDTGGGELTEQITAFKAQDPDAYKKLFADKGWTVSDGKLYNKGADGVSRTGKALGDHLRTMPSTDAAQTLSTFRTAGRDPSFRKQQICDFVDRLHSASDRSVKIGGKSVPMGDVLTSARGKAMMLDTSVNAGPYEKAFQRSADAYFAANPKAGKDPSTWTAAERDTHEAGILAKYEAIRPVTDRATRNQHLAGLSSGADPAGTASKRPARDCPDCPD